jgi:signal transduction histidine kinase/integral membrane sensor domain MASE1/ActR/RegA family two-component response regulator
MPTSRTWLTGAAVTAVYVAAARLGFGLAFVAEQVTTVWAPTGIAAAALLLWGRRLWPAVYAGAFLANAGTNAPLWSAALIAGGNTLEAVAAATLLPRSRFDPGLSRLADAGRFIGLAAMAATTISATIGVTALCLASAQPWSRFTAVWWQWWLGDALGALVIAPLLLTAARPLRPPTRRFWLEAGALVTAALAATQIVFSDVLGPVFGRGPLHYLLFPVVVVAAVRFRQPTTAMVVVGVSVITIVNTVNGAGPFAVARLEEGLILLQAFMGVLAATGLLLAAAMSERLTTQQRLGAAHAVGEVLADAPDLERAAPAILRAICGRLGWQIGGVWLVDARVNRLRCVAMWSEPRPSAVTFIRASEGATLERGVGLPGHVWNRRRAVWIENLPDSDSPRAGAARLAGLRSGLGFPICLGGDVLGVIECFTIRVTTADADLLEAMETIGNQVGQFIGRKRVEESIRLSEEQLRDAARRKDEFIAVLAHELRNPLAPIRTGLELLRRAGDSPGAIERVRTMMARQVTHMVRLIDDLLDVSRITSGKIHLQLAPARLADMVEAAVEANRAAMEAAAVQLDVDLPPQPVVLSVDSTRFVQVISNLLHNATKFSHAGGRIAIRARVATDAAGADALVLTVADQGIGIAGDLLPHVFDLFTQGARPGAGGAAGLGIGLALTQRIVEMHGGRVEARSGGPGLGAEFAVYMPGVQPASGATRAAADPREPQALNRRVLVVDDNADAANMMALLVRTLGAEVRTAYDGPGGIQAATEFLPDVVLLDIGMPGMDGYDTCRQLRQRLGRGPVVVAITGWGQERDQARAFDAGFDAHFTKPADPAVLERLLVDPEGARRRHAEQPPPGIKGG